ncbi:olfactory receptor 1-like [Mantella aurantiaca]
MVILLSGDNAVTSLQCFTQLYFFLFFTTTEVAVLTSMAYDRYMAICDPLHYHSVVSKEKCAVVLLLAWIYGSLNSLFLTSLTSTVSWCDAKDVHQFYCDLKALLRISCNNAGLKVAIYIGTLVDAIAPFLISLISYVKIIKVILQIASKDGREKAYSTCSSHLTVLLSFYGSGASVYLIPSTRNSEELEQIFTLIYTTVTPVLNPLIYTLRNKEVKAALAQLLRIK